MSDVCNSYKKKHCNMYQVILFSLGQDMVPKSQVQAQALSTE